MTMSVGFLDKAECAIEPAGGMMRVVDRSVMRLWSTRGKVVVGQLVGIWFTSDRLDGQDNDDDDDDDQVERVAKYRDERWVVVVTGEGGAVAGQILATDQNKGPSRGKLPIRFFGCDPGWRLVSSWIPRQKYERQTHSFPLTSLCCLRVWFGLAAGCVVYPRRVLTTDGG